MVSCSYVDIVMCEARILMCPFRALLQVHQNSKKNVETLSCHYPWVGFRQTPLIVYEDIFFFFLHAELGSFSSLPCRQGSPANAFQPVGGGKGCGRR